jgi:protein-S-isoprenylcysteine O-methyltransferase Ste14
MTDHAPQRKVVPWLASAVHLVLAPGLVAGLVPWLVTRWHVADHPGWVDPLRWAGLVLALGGAALVTAEFVRFARAGGSPAPPVPTATLVTAGTYRWVRNPMYVAVVAAILGQAAWFVSGWLVVYAAVALLVMTTFVVAYEEPTLRTQFGDDYAAYCRDVPRWIPRKPAQRNRVSAR